MRKKWNIFTDYKSLYSRHSDYKSEWTEQGGGRGINYELRTFLSYKIKQCVALRSEAITNYEKMFN